jgi:tRNA threonylcarbamoyladenosine biosynthesis protein TsaE
MSDDDITSPTYALVHEHEKLVHFDMYRVTTADDLESTGWYDYLGGEKVLAIEWSENITGELPHDAIRVHIETINDNERRITIAHSGD